MLMHYLIKESYKETFIVVFGSLRWFSHSWKTKFTAPFGLGEYCTARVVKSSYWPRNISNCIIIHMLFLNWLNGKDFINMAIPFRMVSGTNEFLQILSLHFYHTLFLISSITLLIFFRKLVIASHTYWCTVRIYAFCTLLSN